MTNFYVGIIGTAGRREDGPKLSGVIYKEMWDKTIEIIEETKKKDIYLVSGGAAWADHLAVALFRNYLKFPDHYSFTVVGLKLHFPVEFDFNKQKFIETGYQSPGSIANYYHYKFATRLGLPEDMSLKSIGMACEKGAEWFANYDGFLARNTAVAYEAKDLLIAFTFGSGSTPKDGGTLDTWKKSKAKGKIHIPIDSL